MHKGTHLSAGEVEILPWGTSSAKENGEFLRVGSFLTHPVTCDTVRIQEHTPNSQEYGGTI
ncbi:hypothetical protein OBV_37240 [Oscillibacter valericigenes Sjm18-20]|nr:hypothetical protein OBV_37240 [Oscillibacter valericigenes Sjm18-20]